MIARHRGGSIARFGDLRAGWLGASARHGRGHGTRPRNHPRLRRSAARKVVITGRRAEVLEQAAGEIERAAGAVAWDAGDVRDRADAGRRSPRCSTATAASTCSSTTRAGTYFTPAELIEEKGWRAVWRHVEGMLNMAEAAYELAMGPASRGTVVNVTLSPHHGMPGMAHSGAARAAVEALTRELAERWAGSGVAARRGCRSFRDRGAREVPRERARRRVAQRSASAPRRARRARVARGAARLAARPRVQRLHDHARPRPRLGRSHPAGLADESGTVRGTEVGSAGTALLPTIKRATRELNPYSELGRLLCSHNTSPAWPSRMVPAPRRWSRLKPGVPRAAAARHDWPIESTVTTGSGAALVAHPAGGRAVAGSNPVSPTSNPPAKALLSVQAFSGLGDITLPRRTCVRGAL